MKMIVPLLASLCLGCIAPIALAASHSERLQHGDVLGIPNNDAAAVPQRRADLPVEGMTMAEVLRDFGKPSKKYAPVGGGSPVRPPITRWDYPGFHVYFEKSHVIHSVVPDAPMPIYHKNQLKPVH